MNQKRDSQPYQIKGVKALLDFSNNSQPLSPVGLWLSAPKGQTALNQRLNKGLNIF